MKTVTTYHDTRGLSEGRPTFSDVIVEGIAPGGGLYVPDALPRFSLEDVLAFEHMPYWRRAAAVFSRFRVDVRSDRVDTFMRRAYGSHFDDERIAPVHQVAPDRWVLELWHGPTSAFKDMALQCMPHFFADAIVRKQERGQLGDDFLILVATSGDTGKAALEGFADRAHCSIVVFYPAEGVSDLQRLQMVTQHGHNVAVFGVRGNFDDCQTAVKAAFADDTFNEWLHIEHRLRLSSANSINWGRLLPQIVYYVSAYADMVAAGGVKAGQPLDICVPTGNFGNILAAYYAKLMGVPIGRLLCASNENNVLADFIATGVYDIDERPFVSTPSPSMDILVSSNLERLLYHLSDEAHVRQWMTGLREHRRFQVDPATFRSLRESFAADFVSNDDSLHTIRRVFDETGYLLDPHTAVAWEVAERLRGDDPVLVVGTAHWAKFGADVHRALNGIGAGEQLPGELAPAGGVGLVSAVARMAPSAAPVPAGLAALGSAKERFDTVVDAGKEAVESAVRDWLATPRSGSA